MDHMADSMEVEYLVQGFEQAVEASVTPNNFHTLATENTAPLQNFEETPNRFILIGANENDQHEATIVHQQNREKVRKKKESSFAFKNKILREQGLDYTGRHRNGQLFEQPERTLGQPCLENAACRTKGKGATFNCHKVTEKMRIEILKNFWSLSWEAKIATVKALCDKSTPKRFQDIEATRTASWCYYLKTESGERLRVCQVMFCSTLGLKLTTLKRWLSEENAQRQSRKVQQARRPPKSSEMKEAALKFLESLPTVPSHYCRATCEARMVESCWESVANLFSAYQETTQDKYVSLTTFERIFRESRFRIHSPRKDVCDVCHEMKLKNEDITSSEHFLEQKAALQQKENLKVELKNKPTVEAFAIDLEAALPCPKLFCRAQYFHTKLSLHNQTTYDYKTKEVNCYLFSEVDAGHDANVYISIMNMHLLKIIASNSEVELIIIVSDSCGYQNKNQHLSNFLLHFCTEHNVTIEHRYLVAGHTHMEVDSFHSLVEKKTKKKELFNPRDYMRAISTARPATTVKRKTRLETEVHNLSYSDFYRFHYSYVKSIRPGKGKEAPTVAKVRAFRYNPDCSMEYKMLVDDDFKKLPQPLKKGTFQIPTKMYSGPQTITESKRKHLQELMPNIPKKKMRFWKSIL